MAIHNERRQFIFALGGAAVAWPLTARAQQPKVPTIGVLVIGNISPEEFWREFRQGLRDLGYIEGQNIRFEFRSAEGQIDRLPELAAELVRLKVDVIVTWFTPTAVAAKQATRDIPIVIAEFAIWGITRDRTFDLSFGRRKDRSTGFPNWQLSWFVSRSMSSSLGSRPPLWRQSKRRGKSRS